MLLLSLFGDMRVLGPDGEDVTPRSRKARALLAHLALDIRHSASRERIVGLLWGDRGEEQARASLRQTLADMRETSPKVAALLESGRQAIRLVTEGWDSDLRSVERAIEGHDPAAAADALLHIRGPLLADLEGVDRTFDDWLRGERTRRLDALMTGALTLAARETDVEVSRAILGHVLRIDPCHEEAARMAMRHDQRQGDLASLHRRYRLLEASLRQEFDAPPSTATRELFRQLSAVGPVAAEPPPVIQPARARGLEPPVILIPPFTSLAQSAEVERLAAIVCDDIQTALGRFADLRILSVPDLAPHKLDWALDSAIASYMLAASVREFGAGLRINLRLNDIASGRIVWSRQQDMALDRYEATIGDIVDKVTGAVLPVIERELAGDRLSDKADATSYAIYLRARALLVAPQGVQEVRDAANYLETVLEDTPDSVGAMMALSQVLNTDFLHMWAGHDPAPMRRRALDLSRQAVQLDPENALAQSRLGWCLLRSGAFSEARRRFEHAASLCPHHADCLEEVGLGMALLGDAEAAERFIGRAFALNPFPRADYFADTALVRFLSGDHGGAEEQFAASEDKSLIYMGARIANLGLCGRIVEARTLAEELIVKFRRIWVGGTVPTASECRQWIHLYLPFAREEERAMISEGLARAGLGT